MKNQSMLFRPMFVAAMLWISSPAQAQDAPTSAAQVLYDQGKAAAQAERWKDALALFEKALTLEPKPKTAAWLGRVQVQLGQYAAGATNLEWYLREEPDISAEVKTSVLDEIARAKQNVATVMLSIEPAGAQVFVDGKRIEDKRISWPVYLTPGAHTFEVKKDGFVTAKFGGTYAQGSSTPMPLVLVPVGKTVPKDEPSPDKPNGTPPLVVAGIAVSSGLAVVGLGTSIATGVSYSGYMTAYNREKCANGDCDQDVATRAATLKALSWTALSAWAGACVVGVATGFYASRNDEGTKPSGKVSVAVVPTLNGLVVHGAW